MNQPSVAWRDCLISDNEAQIRNLLRSTQRVAVLGIKIESQASQAAFYVPAYLQKHGIEIVPVPVYFPDVKTILGAPVYRKVADVPGVIDIVDVFRRPDDIPGHVDDILQAKPRAVWLQSGIRHDGAAEQFAKAGILVVQDRCLMVDHQHYGL